MSETIDLGAPVDPEPQLWLIAEATRKYDLSPVVEAFGTWAVTEYGVESLTTYYPIATADIWKETWPLHMANKRWVTMRDFLMALAFARRHFAVARRGGQPSTGRGLRFRIMRRDGYRCHLCGRSASEDVRLEVDHKIARARGGKSTPENLWTLCYDCNHGKLAEPL